MTMGGTSISTNGEDRFRQELETVGVSRRGVFVGAALADASFSIAGRAAAQASGGTARAPDPNFKE